MTERKTHKTKLRFIKTFIIVMVLLFTSNVSVKASENNNSHTKKVSLNSIILLKEEQSGVRGYLNDNRAVSIAEETMNSIRRQSPRKVVIETNKFTNEKQIDAAIAILEAKYFTYYDLIYSEEVGKGGFKRVEINTSKAYRQYLKSKQIQDRIDNILFKQLDINRNTTEYEAVYKINDWMYNNIEFDYSCKNTTFIDILNTGKGLCCAYTDLFKILSNRVGIECYSVASDKMSHAWNIVVVDGVRYQIDTTWNGCGWYDKWFLLSDKEMFKDHLKYNWIDSYRTEIPNRIVKVKYELNGGDYNNDRNTSYIIEGSSAKLYDASRDGYEFKGWYTQNKTGITNVRSLTQSNNIIKAKWKKVKQPKIKNVKVKNCKNYIRISWNTNDRRNKCNIDIKKCNSNSVFVGNRYIKIYKETNQELKDIKYNIKITAYFTDSAGNKIKSKVTTIKNKVTTINNK